MSNDKSPSIATVQTAGDTSLRDNQSENLKHPRLKSWQRTMVLIALVIAFFASFIAYGRRSVDFAGYAAVGEAFLDGRNIYLDTPEGTNTWPPFFSLAAVPLGMINRVSPYLAHVVWIALTWASIFFALDLIARLLYGKRLKFKADENSLDMASPELLVPFALTLPFIINNFELLQVNMILFAISLWGLYLHSKGRDAAGGIAMALAAALKVMSIAFLPYLLYRRRWRAAFWMAAASVVFFLAPALFIGWAKFWQGVALWPVALHGSWGSGNAQQSVYSMWDRILGYGYIPFAVPGTFMLPLSGARSAKIAWELTCAVAGLLGIVAFRGTPRPDSRWAQIEWAIMFVAATILSPLTRKPYLVVLLLPYALLYAAWRSPVVEPRVRRVLRYIAFACFALSLPTLHDVIGKNLAIRLEMGSVVTYGSLIMLSGLLWYRNLAVREL